MTDRQHLYDRHRRLWPRYVSLLLLAGSAQASAESTLPTVTVLADQSGALAPTRGYQAASSLAVTKTDTPLSELDQSVSVVTRQQLDDVPSSTVAEALRYTPGVYSQSIGGSTRYDYVVLRGFNGHATQNVWLDGLRVLGDAEGFNAVQIDPWFVERMDVVRGADSTLYGQSSPGGMVALSSKRPLSEAYRQLEVGLGSQQQKSLALDVTGPVNQRADLSYRLVAKGESSNQQQDWAHSERYTVAPSLAWQMNSANRLLLQAYVQNEPSTGFHGSLPYAGSAVDYRGARLPASFNDGVPGNGMSRRLALAGYQYEHDFSTDWQFRQNLRWQQASISLKQLYQTGWDSQQPGLLARAVSVSDETADGVSLDNQLLGRLDTGEVSHRLLVGFDSYRLRNDGVHRSGSANSVDPFNPGATPAQIVLGASSHFSHINSQSGLYLQDQMAYRHWRLNLGFRHDWARVASDNSSGPDVGWQGQASTRRLGLLYAADNGFSPYFSYSEGFDPSASYPTDSQGQGLQPSESKQQELGLKYQLPNHATQFGAALYQLRQDHLAWFDVLSQSYLPMGDVRARGLELEMKSRIARKLNIMLAYSLNQMRIMTGPQAGQTPFASPGSMASFWADYAVKPGLVLGAGLRYTGPSWVDSANTQRLPSNTLLDTMARLDLGLIKPDWAGASLRLAASNLLDRTYVASCYNSFNYCYYGARRSINASLGVQW